MLLRCQLTPATAKIIVTNDGNTPPAARSNNATPGRMWDAPVITMAAPLTADAPQR
jgi:hypothetical protein